MYRCRARHKADRIDHAVGARKGGLYGALVTRIGGNLFDVVALNLPRTP
jgi:hypothetical protein